MLQILNLIQMQMEEDANQEVDEDFESFQLDGLQDDLVLDDFNDEH